MAAALQFPGGVETSFRAMVRKIWEERPTPATGAVGQTYLGTLRGEPAAGRRMEMALDSSGSRPHRRLVTSPVQRIRGGRRGLLYVEAGCSIYRVHLGQPSVCRRLVPRKATQRDERRAFARVDVRSTVEMEYEGRARLGFVRNVSGSGALIRCGLPCDVGNRIELVLRLEPAALGTHVSGTVVRVMRDADDGDWVLPCQIAVHFDEPWMVG